MAEVEMTEKQKMFVKQYLIDLNATQAAIRSGYSEDTARQIGYSNLLKPYIYDAIQKELDKRAKKVEVSAEYVLGNLKKVADKCMEEEKFDSSGATRALELLGKYLKLFTEKVENNINANIEMSEEDRKLLNNLAERLK